MRALFIRFVRDEEGQDLIEYALLAAFVSVVSAGTMYLLGGYIKDVFLKVNEELLKAKP